MRIVHRECLLDINARGTSDVDVKISGEVCAVASERSDVRVCATKCSKTSRGEAKVHFKRLSS